MKQIFRRLVKHNILFISGICFLILAGYFFLSESNKTAGTKPDPSPAVPHDEAPATGRLNVPADSLTPPTSIIISKYIPPAIRVQNQTPAPSPVPTGNIQNIQTPKTPNENRLFLNIQSPGQNQSFSVSYQNGLNPCTLLNTAKDTGLISSVTVIRYGPPLNSDYVSEINGKKDNWTFSLNGEQKPAGCSNYDLNINDHVTWKFN